MSDYLNPDELITAMVDSGAKKAKLGASDILIRAALSGAILGFAESLAAAAAVATGDALVDAVLFPIGFIMIVLLNLELFTGACALVPIAAFAGRASGGQILRLIGVTAWPGDRPQYYPAAGRDEGEMAAGDLDVAIAADQEISQPGRSRSGIKIR